MIDVNILCEADIFKGFTKEEILGVMDKLHYSLSRYSKGEVIVHEGEPVEAVHFVHKGTVRTFFTTGNGREVHVNNLCSPSAIFQGSVLADGATTYAIGAVALEEVTIISVPRDEMMQVLENNPKVLMNFLKYFSEKNVEINQRIRVLLIKTIPQKLAYYILDLAGNDYDTVQLQMTQTELADFLAVTRPSLARGLRQLAESGLIRYKTRTIHILDKDGLVDLLDS